MSYILCRKALNFDLDTKALKKYYGKKNYRQAYTDIKSFMENEGFKHRQWSGYVSRDKIAVTDMNMLIKKMKITFPWLKKCVKRFDVTDIGKQHDLTYIITGKSNAEVKKKVPVTKAQRKNSFSINKLERISKMLNSEKHNIEKQKIKKNEMER